MLAILKINSFL